MAGGHGGARVGAGKPRGAKRKITEEAIKRAGAGETPLEYMLRIMRDKKEDPDRRDKMAIAAATYVHPRGVELTGANGSPIETVNELVFRGIRADDTRN
jgi:hypothetical protein